MNVGHKETHPSQFLNDNFSSEDVKRIVQAMEETTQPLDVVVVELGTMQEEKLARALADFFSCQFIARPALLGRDELVAKLGFDFCLLYKALPIHTVGSVEPTICLADPFDSVLIQLIGYALGAKPSICIATRNSLDAAFRELSDNTGGSSPSDEAENFELATTDIERLKIVAEEAPVVRLVGRLIQTAVDAGASDIHIEPMAQQVHIRLRLDGVLIPFEKVPASLLPGIATRIKIMSSLNISERRLPQDGRMQIAVRGVDVDLRISIAPSIHGETIVIRVLDRSRISLDLRSLGFDAASCEVLKSLSGLANGVVLFTGPTGSGKTTSLYAMLDLMVHEKRKIFTVEDPVEYPIEGATQLQVDPAIDLTFGAALRSVLRQDPDVILVGEIRDLETAELTVQAALTGHLVLSTLHTNSAVGAITRLRDMGIDNYLIGATLKASIGQRLLRKTCHTCRVSDQSNCLECSGTGHSGRTAVYEILQIHASTSRLIGAGESESRILASGQKSEFQSMRQCAEKLVKNRIVSQEELLRVLSFEG